MGQELPDAYLAACRYKKSNEWYTGQVYHAIRTLQVHRIFRDVFGESQRQRLVLVMGGAQIHNFYEDSHLYAINSKLINPDGLRPDAYAVAPYIGHKIDPEAPDAFGQLMGEAIPTRIARVATIAAEMNKNGIAMVCYEGGQHIKHTLDAAIPFQKRPEMYELYTSYLTGLSKHVTHFSHYTHTGGSWGAKEFIGEDDARAPKYRALRDWSARHNRKRP
jgi:hypothetical protein